MKMKLFDIVTDPQIDTLAYVDCDMLFSIPGCAKEFVTGGVPWEDRKIRFTRVDLDHKGDTGRHSSTAETTTVTNETNGSGTGRLVGLHAGTIVMHREHSKDVLHRWYKQIKKQDSVYDRVGYMGAYNELQAEIDAHWRNESKAGIPPAHLNIMLPSERSLRHPTTGARVSFEKFLNFQDDNYTAPEPPPHCMLHISKGRCEHTSRSQIQSVVDRYRLRTYQKGGYRYCPNKRIIPLTYGFLPLSLLPFCPKAEHYF